MNKNGFTIIELLFSLMIASFLIMTLTIILGQTGRAKDFAQKEVHTALLKNSLINVLYQDCVGIFFLESKKDENKDSKEKTKTSSATKEEEIPPVIIKRSSENMVEEIRFTTICASMYQQSPIPTEVVYSLIPDNSPKKTYKIQRNITVKNIDQSKQKKHEPITFLENIVKCTAQLVKVAKKENENKESFELIDSWPSEKREDKKEVKKEKNTEKSEGKNQSQKPEEKKEEKKAEIPYIKITIIYVVNDKGAQETFTLFIPLFIYKNESEKPDQSVSAKATPDKGQKESSPTDKPTDKKESAKNPTVAQNRASKALGSIFGGIK